jgi:cytochrome c-type biogenesis protein CcsB
MEIFIIITALIYLLSSAGYLMYLFLQTDRLHKTGYGLFVAGFVVHSLALALALIKSGHLPAGNLPGNLLIATWVLSAAFLYFQFKFKLKVMGIFAAPLAGLIMVLVSGLDWAPMPARTIFNNFWFVLHIVTIFSGEAMFALACALGILYLIQEHAIKTKKRGFFFNRLPSLDALDTTGYACIAAGFTLLTIGLITGLVYAKVIWGRFLGWDPKEIWSGISWLVYAILLHERLTVGWRGRKAAIWSIVGFAVLLFTFLGVNFLLEGHHGAFTRW